MMLMKKKKLDRVREGPVSSIVDRSADQLSLFFLSSSVLFAFFVVVQPPHGRHHSSQKYDSFSIQANPFEVSMPGRTFLESGGSFAAADCHVCRWVDR